MPVFKNYPYLWMAITLDGFGSHLEGDALKVFADHKILIVKEEGDTSQVYQAYDNEVSKSDKRLVNLYFAYLWAILCTLLGKI